MISSFLKRGGEYRMFAPSGKTVSVKWDAEKRHYTIDVSDGRETETRKLIDEVNNFVWGLLQVV
jgi:hypothetical protein